MWNGEADFPSSSPLSLPFSALLPPIPSLFPFPLPLTLISLALEVGPLNPANGLGSAVSSPPSWSADPDGGAYSAPGGGGAMPQPKSNLVHFSVKILHLVATILIILRIN